MRLFTPALLLASLSTVAQTWTQLPDFPGTARDDAASFTIGSKVHVGTGMDLGFQLTNDWYAFDVMTQTWTPIAALPADARQYCTAVALNGTGYVFGGLSTTGPLDELWRYDPVNDAWEQGASLPAPGRYASTSFTIADSLYICTGMLADGLPTNETWRYDPATDTWAARSPVPGPAKHRASSLGASVIGGADSAYNALVGFYLYDWVSDFWVQNPPVSFSRFSSDAAGGYLIAGASSTTTVHNEVWDCTSGWMCETTDALDFPGGPRRGGVSGTNEAISDLGILYYGTGSDNVQRYGDWWKLEYPVGIHEPDVIVCTLSPVPADASLRISFAHPATLRSLIITDVHGRVMLREWDSAGSAVVHTAQLANGLYIMQAWSGTERFSQRFTVQH